MPERRVRFALALFLCKCEEVIHGCKTRNQERAENRRTRMEGKMCIAQIYPQDMAFAK
jgi:hypothetical protein